MFIIGCTAREYKLSGDIFVKTGEYEKAITQYQEWAEMEDDSPEPFVSLSVPYYRKNNYRKSAEYLKKAFEIDRDAAEETVLFYENFLEAENYTWSVFYNGAKEFLDSQQLDIARRLVEEAEEVDDSIHKSMSYVLHGRIYIMEGQEDTAFDYLNKAVDLDEDNGEAYVYLGKIYSNQNKIDTSISFLKKAISKDPDNFLGYKWLGQNYLRIEKYDKAVEMFEKAASIRKNDTAILYNLACAYLQKEDYSRASDLAEKILGLPELESDAKAEAYIILGISNINKEEYNEAIEVLNKAIEADSDKCDSYQLLADAYHKAGKVELSKKFAEEWEKCVKK
jgi:tetratricopeptide (TPR) repeat protein